MNSFHRFDLQQLESIKRILAHLNQDPDEASLVKMVREIDETVKK